MTRRRLATAALIVAAIAAAIVMLRRGAGRTPGNRATGAADTSTAGKPVPSSADTGSGSAAPRSYDPDRVGSYARALYAGQPPDRPDSYLTAPSEGVYVAARSGGQLLADRWSSGGTRSDSLADAIAHLRETLGSRAADADRLELFIARETRELDPVRHRRTLRSNIYRGVRGLELSTGDVVERTSPTTAIAQNRKNERLIQLFAEKHHLDSAAMKERVTYRVFDGEQLIVDIATGTSIAMERGNTYVPLSAVTQEQTREFADGMAGWLTANVHDDGRMTYLYWPSVGGEAPDRNNMIRQWMATVALDRVAADHQSEEVWALAARNIDYNLAQFYREDGDRGFIEYQGKAKLGAMALAALAIVEHPARHRWRAQEQALRRTIDSLWNPDGSFRTFYKPAGRNDNQNFYPGEALLLWAVLYQSEPTPELRDRFMKSFEYYRSWHLDPKNRNPAFIPWHTQADYLMWTATQDDELRDFIFDTNDWLLDVQQWDGVLFRDTRGRFHDPDRPFGPPHASSTGVYLEGLIDAYLLARASNDSRRAEAYQRAIRRGLRSSMQLQFSDEVDMFYISQRDPVRGGLRTTVYDNQIRCDNVQHTLMGTLKILASDVLTSAPEEADEAGGSGGR